MAMDSPEFVITAVGVGIAAVSGIVGVVWRLSSKIYTVEIWARDEFVRKSSFETVVGRLERGMDDLGNKIQVRLDKISERIEKIPHN